MRPTGVLSTLVAVLVAISAACSSDLTRSSAAALLEEAPAHSKPLVYTLREGTVTPQWSPLEASRNDAKTWTALAREGLIELEDLGRDPTAFGPPFFNRYEIRLTDKGRETFDAGPEGTWSIVVAHKRVQEVTGIVKHIPTVADVEYTWSYELESPLAELCLPGLGTTPEDITRPQKGRAVFRKFDDGWRLNK